MRLVIILGLLAGLLNYTQAQEFGKDRKDTSKDKSSLIQELGGKTLDQWIKDISGKDRSKGEHALQMIQLFPPDQAYAAVPAMLGELSKHKPGFPIDLSIRVNCVIALGNIIGGAKTPTTAHTKETVRLLTAMLNDTQAILRFRAAEALGKIGPEAHSAMSALIPIVKDGSTWEIRWAATQALGFVSIDPEKIKEGPTLGCLSALYYALTDSSGKVRMTAIQSLTVLGRYANPEYKKGLIKQLDIVTQKDVEPTVQIWAHMAIMSINGSEGKDGVTRFEVSDTRLAAIGKMLQHQEATVRIQAATAIGVLGKDGRKQIGALTATLKDKEPEVVGVCVVALGRMGRTALPAVPALERVKEDRNLPEALRKTAADVIDLIQGKMAEK